MMSRTNTDAASNDSGSGPVERALLLAVEAYRVTLSPLLGGLCRFEPSCSRYAEEAIRRHGALAGTRLAVGRLLRCQPFAQGGHDPVP